MDEKERDFATELRAEAMLSGDMGDGLLWKSAAYIRTLEERLAVLPSRETPSAIADELQSWIGKPVNLMRDLAMQAAVDELRARETVAPTEEQIARAMLMGTRRVYQDGRTPEQQVDIAWADFEVREMWISRARAVLALFPGEGREAVEAKARAEGREEVMEWNAFPEWLRNQAREQFGIGDDRG